MPSLETLNLIVAEELRNMPRDTPAQRLRRAAYQNARLNGLGSRPQLPATPEAADRIALETVRKYFPDFEGE